VRPLVLAAAKVPRSLRQTRRRLSPGRTDRETLSIAPTLPSRSATVLRPRGTAQGSLRLVGRAVCLCRNVGTRASRGCFQKSQWVETHTTRVSTNGNGSGQVPAAQLQAARIGNCAARVRFKTSVTQPKSVVVLTIIFKFITSYIAIFYSRIHRPQLCCCSMTFQHVSYDSSSLELESTFSETLICSHWPPSGIIVFG